MTDNARDRVPGLGVMLQEGLPEDLASDLFETAAALGIETQLKRLPVGPWAGVELYLPTIVAVVLTPYLAGFLGKAGEEHYTVLKAAAARLWQRMATVRISAAGTAGKLSKAPHYSLAYSIMAEVSGGYHLKFILQTTIDERAAQRGVGDFMDLVRSIHSGEVAESTLNELLVYRPVGRVILVTFDPISGRLCPVDGLAAR